jgi:hypothetical protein
MQADYTIDQLRARVLLATSFTTSASEIHPAGLVIIGGETTDTAMEAKNWSDGVYEIPNSKHYISGFQVSGEETQRLKPEH